MISFNEARKRILDSLPLLGAEQVSLDAAVGRVLAEDIYARRTQPPKPVSAMDGYAVRSGDLAQAPCWLEVVDSIAAGSLPSCAPLQAGQAARIFTGAPLPQGADAILIQENVETPDLPRIKALESVAVGRYVRPAGLDFCEGALGISAGTRLSPRHIGLAAAMNHPWLMVRRRPRVAILSTGNELVMPGEPLQDGQIISANSQSLAALVRAQGCEALSLGIAQDRLDSLLPALEAAAGSDIILTSGGASVGAHDLIGAALRNHGLEVAFWKIAMRPGKPLVFGHFRGTPFLGLPGNPVSSLVGGMLILAPMLARMQGYDLSETWQKRPLACTIPPNDNREEFMRATLDLDGSVRPLPKQDSAILSFLAQADGFIRRPAHAPLLEKGALVDYLDFAGGF